MKYCISSNPSMNARFEIRSVWSTKSKGNDVFYA